MKSKLFAALLALMVLCLGTVAEADTTVTTSSDLALAVATEASGDIILGGSITLTDVIPVGRSVKITGGGYTLTAGGSAVARHFNIAASNTLTLDGTLTLAGSSSAGGGIEVVGTLTCTGAVTFQSNYAVSGGALHIANGGAATFGSTADFTSNSTTATTSTGCGGAVYVENNATLTFNAVPTFTSNTANVSGGAIYAVTGATLNFNAAPTFANNTATTGNGGAIWVGSASQIPTTIAMTFTGNTASATATTGNGGAVYIDGTTSALTLNDYFTFNGNTAGLNGGAVYSKGAVTVTGGAFGSTAGNTATGDGGAIYSEGRTTVSGGTFANNGAANGGAVYSAAASGAVTVSGASFSSNTATASGGALYYNNTSGAVSITGATFGSNTAATNGGAVYSTNTSDMLTVTNSTFTSNTATAGNGGALWAGGDVTIEGSYFGTDSAGADAGNSSGTDGGAIYAAGEVTITPNTTNPDPDFANNSAGVRGGAVSCNKLTASNAVFSSNSSVSTGGAVYAATTITVENSGFTSNYTTGTAGSGGALAAVTVEASNTSFISNRARQASGGAIFGIPVLEHTYFYDNRAALQGGAVSSTGQTQIKTSVFRDNAANGNGGALSLAQSQVAVTIEDSYFTGNAAGTSTTNDDFQGGAIFLNNVGVATISCSSFEGNTITSGKTAVGGGVYMNPTDTASRVENCTFAGNIADSPSDSAGGGLTIAGPGNVINCTFTLGNEAKGYGGGVYVNDSSNNVAMAGCIVSGNTAPFGNDVFLGSGVTLFSGGYNRVGVFGYDSGGTPGNSSWTRSGLVISGTARDIQDATWGTQTFFGNSPVLDKSVNPKAGTVSGTSGTLYTVSVPSIQPNELDPSVSRALDIIPRASIPSGAISGFPTKDQRGTTRPQPTGGASDAGAVETQQESSDSDETAYSISSVKIGGIPNTLTTVGQTAALYATVTYLNGTTSTTEGVSWSSSRPAVAVIQDNGVIYSRGLGTTVISVATARNTSSGSPATDSVSLTVSNEMRYLNVSPNVWNLLDAVNREQDDFIMSFVDADPALVNASAFRTPFSSAWSASPQQVTSLASTSSFQVSTKTAGYAEGGYTASKNSASLALSGQQQGMVLPMKYTWSLSWAELSKLLGRTVSSKPSTSALFGALKVGLETSGGKYVPVIGSGGVSAASLGTVSAAAAEESGALTVTQTNNGVVIEVTAYLSNVAGGSAQLINGLLAVPDGVSDSSISGTLWLLASPQAAEDNGSGGGGGGGGGCSLSGLGLGALWLLAAVALRRRTR